MPQYKKLYTVGWSDYELLDAGGGKKLEKWGDIITIRPEKQAYFNSGIPFSKWREMAHWEFKEYKSTSGEWVKMKHSDKKDWLIKYQKNTFQLKLTSFKHLGLFPEQKTNWDYLESRLSKKDRFLNLFGYTGAASCIARLTDADVYHVDSIKQVISWAKENMTLSKTKNIHWVQEDALKFATREMKRGNLYNGIILDPPAWGYGAKGERWKIENKIESLLFVCNAILEKGGFLILNTYSPKLKLEEINSIINKTFPNCEKEMCELWMKSQTNKKLYFGNLVRLIKK